MSATAVPAMSPAERANSRNALIAGFLGWTLDAFDFFILTYVLTQVAAEFHKSVAEMTLTITASLMMRPVGAFLFGLMADRYGRRLPLMIDVIFYSIVEVLSGFAPSYRVFFILRLLYGIGMGGEWGVGASLAMESVPAKWRGILSGVLQEGYALGNLLAAVAFWTIFPHWGWRPMFFHRRVACPADAFHPRESKRERRVEGDRRCADNLGRLFPRRRRQWEALPLPGAADGCAQFHVARHAGSLPDVPPAPAPF